MLLNDYGWNDTFQQFFDGLNKPHLQPARVAMQGKDHYRLLTREGLLPGRLTGKLLASTAAAELPAVGDWVAVQMLDDNQQAIIHHLLPRKSVFSRKTAGTNTTEQVIAANVDVAFIVNGLDGDFNLRRIERYLTLVYDSGAVPVIVLNKSDLCSDLADKLAAVEEIAFGVDIVVLSAAYQSGLDALQPWLFAGNTVVLVGSSGVGKSTLTNALLGAESQAVREVRQGDSRGRHTTSHRELFHLASGALLVDTPGMRELQLWASEETLTQTFEDLDTIAESCRFRDCQHGQEPGCAVQSALQSGELAMERYQSFLKQRRELRFLARKQDTVARLEEEKRWKQITKTMREHNKKKR